MGHGDSGGCDIHYEEDPTDFQISKEDLSAFFYNRNVEQFDLNVAGEQFSFVQMNTVDKGAQYSFTCPPEKIDHAFLLKSLLQGDKITIDSQNSTFLKEAAVVLQIEELEEICEKYQQKGYIEPSFHSVFRNVLKWLSSVFRHCAVPTKILLTLWDIVGAVVILGFFTNVIILIITMALYTIQHSAVRFIFVMMPLAFYSLFFGNIMCIAVWEFCKFQMFRISSPWSSVQILAMKFVRLTKCGTPAKSLYWKIPVVYEIVIGVLGVVILITFVCQVFSRHASSWISAYIFVFAVILPIFKYIIIIIEYAIHGFASCFEYCRQRYTEIGDFSDPFLNAIYFREHPFMRLWPILFSNNAPRKRGRMGDTISDSGENNNSNNNDQTDNESEGDNEVSMSSLESTEEMIRGARRNGDQSNASLIALGIFSRDMFSLFVVFCLIIYLLVEFINTSLTAAQACSIIFLFELFVIPICCFMPLPFYWIRRQRDKPMTKARLENEKEDLPSTKDYKTYTEHLAIWDNKFIVLRWSSMIVNAAIIFLFFIFIVMCIAIAKNPNYFNEEVPSDGNKRSTQTSTTEKWYEPSVRLNATADFRKTTNPICFTKVKGLTTEQIMSLTDASYYYSSDEEESFKYILTEYFGSEWEDHIEVIDTNFSNNKYKISLSHFKFPDLNLIVFSIKGTSNLNEVLADIEMWCSSAIFGVFSNLIPFFETYGEYGRTMTEFAMSTPRFIFKQFSLVNEFVDMLSEYIESVEIPEDYDVLVTGHSLGGGLAKIVSLKTGYQAFSVSGPDVKTVEAFYSTDKTKNITRTFINVAPAQDYVSMVDTTYAQSKYHIPCQSGFRKCHSIVRTLCQTNVLCGNKELHDDFCKKIFTEKEYNEMIELGSPVDI